MREALRGGDRVEAGLPLPPRQRSAYDSILALIALEVPLLITPQLLDILEHPDNFTIASSLIPHFQVVAPARYLRRWARRLREEEFSREDALLLAHASFGIDEPRPAFGAGILLTTDYALKNRYERNIGHIERRFHRMTRQLKPPYRDATLPSILTPEELLDSLGD